MVRQTNGRSQNRLRRRGPEDGAGDAPKEEQDTVDQKTRQALKQDKFVSTTTQSLEWASEHRQSVMTATWIVLAAVLAAIVGGLVYNMRSDSAAAAFGAAMQVYQSPLTQPGEPVPPGAKAYTTSAERAKAANALFLAIADKYGMTPSGENARYFAGLTYSDAGETQQAEDTLKQVAGGWNKNLAALAKFSLAQLYRNSGRDPQAIDLYNQLSAKPTTTVPVWDRATATGGAVSVGRQSQASEGHLRGVEGQGRKGAGGRHRGGEAES